jgi:lysophospholipid acyltransferase (LPLAT)-like uncharacterized protein
VSSSRVESSTAIEGRPAQKTQGRSPWSGAPSRSRRRLGPARRLAHSIAVPLSLFLAKVLWNWCRSVRVEIDPDAKRLFEGPDPVIPCFWHHQTVFCLWYLLDRNPGDHRWAALVSPSVDGDLVKRVIEHWNVRVTRGSATRTGSQAIRRLYRMIREERLSLFVLPDGPQGPARQAKPGAVVLGQLSEAPVLPMGYAVSRRWRATSWDRMWIPKPLSRVAVVLGPPIRVPRNLHPREIETYRLRLEQSLEAQTRRAEALVG